MKSILIIILLALAGLSGSAYISIEQFTATYQGVDVRLDWNASDEVNVQAFEIARRIDASHPYKNITSLEPESKGRYFFIDDNLYQVDIAENKMLQYRLTAKTASGDQHFYATIKHSPTAVQQSWGNIKAMFK